MDDAQQSDFVKHILRLAASGLLGGAAVRVGMGALRNANPRYEPPTAPKPMVVDMPYYTDRPVAEAPLPDIKKERQVGVAKRAAFLDYVPFGGSIGSALPTFQDPVGNPGQSSGEIPLTTALGVPAAGLGALAGYGILDKVMRAADRRRAHGELSDAQREYQQAILQRLKTRDTRKSAADADEGLTKAAEAALARAYDRIKQAEGEAELQPSGKSLGYRALMSFLFPAMMTGNNDVALANAALVGGMGALGGYAGYSYARDDEQAGKVRKEIKKIDRTNAEGMQPPIVARLVPVHRPV